jgi:tight adherence protein B
LRLHAVITACSLAAIVLAAAAGATAADQVSLTEASAAFPHRAYVLSLPSGQRLNTSAVKVTENGHGVVKLAVAPASSATNVASGTVLAIDASDSMRGAPIAGALTAARAFVARRNVNQRLGVETFNSSTQVAVPITVDQASIDKALAKTPALRNRTHLYDAIEQAIAQLQASQVGAGSIVVLSDGADIGSSVTLEQAIQSAKNAHVRIFTVGLRSKTFRPVPLQQMATATGGTFSSANSPTDLQKIYDQLGLQLAQEYIVSYNSKEKPGTPVRLAVSVPGIGTTSAAYVAPALAGTTGVFHPSAADSVWESGITMILIALLVPTLVAAAIVIPVRRRNSTVRARVSDYVSMPQQRQKRELDALVSRVFTGTEQTLEKTRWWQRFKDALAFADVPFPPVYVVVGTLVITLFAAWVLYLVAPVLALFAIGVPLIIRAIIKTRISRKRKLFANQLADNLDVLASGLRAGHSLVGALAVVVADAAEPSKTEFRRVVADEQLGVPLENALDRVVERMKNRDLEQVALVASLQAETGGNAAEVLDRVTESIRERQELRRLIQTLTAQGRLARWIVSLLPIGLLLAIAFINPGYMRPMFHHVAGLIALMLGVVMIIAGSVIIGRIVDIDV